MKENESPVEARPSGSAEGAAAPAQGSPALPAAAVPSIRMPNGGGAIRGIGETFSVNASNGTASLSVPIPASPNRSGFTPQLALSYDSGSGNTPFGFGWSLGIPRITRKTDKGLPRYRDGEESDEFVLSGAEDLVPILESGRRMHFSRTVHGVAYEVHCYRPRTEGLFARIERWANQASGISHWRTIGRDGVTSLYGYDAWSRLADPHDAKRVFQWCLSRTWDDRGNVAVYDYVADDERGIARHSAHEANRTREARETNRYLSAIRYGNATTFFPVWNETGSDTPLPADFYFTIAFDYGDHPETDPLPTPSVAWPARPDPFSTFRAGFEIRTYRRCSRILVFHHFAAEPKVGPNRLVRLLELRYSDQDTPPDPHHPVHTFLRSITVHGFGEGTPAARRQLPPLEFEYSEPEVRPGVHTLDGESLANLPEGLDGVRHRFVDLDGEGAAGILTESNGGWTYKRNLSPLGARARFGPAEPVAALPSHHELGRGPQLLDLSGDGQLDAVLFAGPVPGFFERTFEQSWQPFRAFGSVPVVDWTDPNLKFVDLTGDGRADLLITEDDVFTFHPSLGESGFGASERVPLPVNERLGPRVVFGDGTETMFLADMSGDGLSDLVRIRNGEVAYWPNLGYGRFGAKITMDASPRFTDEERFDPRRVRLADIDGSGSTDLLYIGETGVQVSFNRSGNSWAAPYRLAVFPASDLLSDVQVIDLLGSGTACLVWSSPLPSHTRAPLRYVDLMGGRKPHLMIRVRNNLGAETRLAYAPSTRFYLLDRAAGQPWVTRLPFPVHVVERVETYDWIGRSRFVTRYAYHHGHFDGEEREFRGFGMVEQWDTETHRDDTLFPEVDPLNEDDASFVPPVRTKTWFHTGAFVDGTRVSRQYAGEYWHEPALRGDAPGNAAARAAMLLPDTVIETGGLDPDELREAFRALKGSTLRVETYADDGSGKEENPYVVTEQNFAVRRLQARGPNRHAVFLPFRRETIGYHYERQTGDPRVAHEIALEVDDFANVCRSVTIGYPRRAGYPEPEPHLSPAFRDMLAHDQTRLHVRGTHNIFTDPIRRVEEKAALDAYRSPLPADTILAEMTGIAPAAVLFRFDDMQTHWATLWDGAHDLAYESVAKSDVDGAGAPQPAGRRVIQRTRKLYRSNDLTHFLPPRRAESMAIAGESYLLAFTPAMIARIFDPSVTGAVLREGGYVELPGESGWWIPSGLLFFSPADGDPPAQELAEARKHFFLPRRAVDPFGAVSRVTYDDYHLLARIAIDAAGNVTAAENDYRVLQPFRVTDPNGNRVEAAFSALGEKTGSAVIGKSGEGDTMTGFRADLTEAELLALRNDPLANPAGLLGDATVRIVYDELAYFRTRDQPQPDPPLVYTLTRETHLSDLASGAATRHHHHFIYSDGAGHEIQHKTQAEPGPVPGETGDVTPRWVASGWTIYDNKGHVVRRYEPFFTKTHRFEFNRQAGVSSVMFHDPLGRLVASMHPDRTIEKVVFDAWRIESWDRNDTVRISDPRADPDAGGFFRRLLGNAPFVSWHDLRIGGSHGATADERSANKDAAEKAAAHGDTPSTAHLDAVDRTCLLVTHNGIVAGKPQRLATRTAYDGEGQALAVFDARGLRVMEYCLREPAGTGFEYVAGWDLAGRLLYRNGMDDGERRSLSSVAGEPVRLFDARGSRFRYRYDALRRPTHLYVTPKAAAEQLLERRVYGERHPDASRNLKGKLFRQYDGAGLAMHARFDFKGNLLESVRHLALDYRALPNWTAVETITETPVLDVAALDAAAAPALDPNERFTAFTRFDALDQPIQAVTPHQTTGRPSVLQPRYNDAGLLEAMDVWIRRVSVPAGPLDPATADLHAVTDVDHDAMGRRTLVAQGNGATTTYRYDAETFRLSAIVTARPHTDPKARTVQDLAYTYDPAGNITRIRDAADIHNVVFFSNQRVEPSTDYTYDPIYRLIAAKGREHLGRTTSLQPPVQPVHHDRPRMEFPPGTRLISPGDGEALATYTEQYEYDLAGNLTAMIHQVSSGTWTRRHQYGENSRITASEKSNRLSATSLPGDPVGTFSAPYAHDEHGNIRQMPHLPVMIWNVMDRLQSTSRQSIGAGTPEMTHYTYDASGERVRKVTDWDAAPATRPARKSERIYLGAFEIHREYDAAGVLRKERETLHVLDDLQRVALVETRTAGTDPAPAQMIRYQYSNHLGTAALELDHTAAVVSYEELFPYGATAYQAVRGATETPKRYRFTGKERDEENDFTYHGARYYAPWLGRWTACDPAGLTDGVNVYVYTRNNPIRLFDPNGAQAKPPDAGTPDASANDAGAGPPDGGGPPPDAGPSPGDAGAVDGGSAAGATATAAAAVPPKDQKKAEADLLAAHRISATVAEARDLAIQGGRTKTNKKPPLTTADADELKKRIEKAAADVGLDPGFLAANLFAEIGPRRSNLKRVAIDKATRIRTVFIGVDDIATDAAHIRRTVPAFSAVTLTDDGSSFTPEHVDATTPPTKAVKQVRSDQAILTLAAVVKAKENKIRELAADRGIDFDKLPVEQRFFLTRLSFNPGRGKAGRKHIGDALTKIKSGGDPLRTNITSPDQKAGDPVRGATLVTVAGLHLSHTFFGKTPFQ